MRTPVVLAFLLSASLVWQSPSSAKSIDTDGSTACAITNGGLQCWGAGEYGQLGQGDTLASPYPLWVKGMRAGAGVTDVSVGGGQVCAVRHGGIYCWGKNYAAEFEGQNSVVSTPQVLIEEGSGAAEVAAGEYHACAAVAGNVFCWGISYSAKALGPNATFAAKTPVLVPGVQVDLQAGGPVVAAGNETSCALVDGGVKCWGSTLLPNSALATDPEDVPSLEPASALHPAVTSIAVGSSKACALLETGQVRCWGSHMLGDGGYADKEIVTVLDADFSDAMLAGVSQLSVSQGMACTTKADGATHCWGDGDNYGAMGTGIPDNNFKATKVPGLPPADEVAAGARGGCSRATTGQVSCWGSQQFGALGDGSDSIRRTPSPMLLAAGVSTVAAAADHSCAIVEGGAKCWGWYKFGRLGFNSQYAVPVPQWVIDHPSQSGVSDIAVGDSHSCSLTSAGWLRCWGDGSSGQLGVDYFADTWNPQTVTGNYQSVSLGFGHSCAVDDSSHAKCWGLGTDGQLGYGAETFQSAVPGIVVTDTSGSPLENVSAVKAGNRHTCALSNSQVWCWGRNYKGQLGYDTSGADQTFAKQVLSLPAGTTVLRLAAGGYHTCVALSDQTVWCWGSNSSGQSGAGTAHIPREVYEGSVAQLVAGEAFTCLRKPGGAAMCWGDNEYGQLGNGSFADSATPVQVAVPAGVIPMSLSSGPTARHVCATTSSTPYCWGDGFYGERGDATVGYTTVPSGGGVPLNFADGFE